jgi:putative phosphoesterase
MRVAFTADLHYGRNATGDTAVRDLAENLAGRDLDALVVAGDVALADPRALVECLQLFDDTAPVRMALPGNHDLWTTGRGADSLAIRERIFPEAVRLAGFHPLDTTPLPLGDIGFVGSIGWYDYSFADPTLDIPRSCYEDKLLPGVSRWNDGRYIQWDHTDESFTAHVLEGLRNQLATLADAREIIVVTHHLPFEALVRRRKIKAWSFANAFMGSARMGELILDDQRVRLCVCGHSHTPADVEIEGVRAVNTGSNYRVKRAVICEIGEGSPNIAEQIRIG